MSTAFLLVQLSESTAFNFGQPLLNWVKEKALQTDILDIDSHSDEFLVTHAIRLAKESERLIVYFKTSFPNMALGQAFRVIEEVIHEHKPNLILLEGTHRQVAGIFGSRDHMNFVQNTNPEPLKEELEKFLHLGS